MATDDGNAEKKNALNREFHALLREMNHRVDAVMEEMKKKTGCPPGLEVTPKKSSKFTESTKRRSGFSEKNTKH